MREDGDRWRRDSEFRWYRCWSRRSRGCDRGAAAAQDAPLAEHLAAAARPQLQVRLTIALLASLIVPATWLLVSWFVGRSWAFFAAALVAASLLDVSFSQQSRPHAVSGAVFLAAVLAAVRMRRSADLPSYLLAGGAAALAIGCLQSGITVLPPLVVAYLACGVPRTRRFDPRAERAAAAVVRGAAVLVRPVG